MVLSLADRTFQPRSRVFGEVNFFLSAKYRDFMETQREADRTTLVSELSNELREEVLYIKADEDES